MNEMSRHDNDCAPGFYCVKGAAAATACPRDLPNILRDQGYDTLNPFGGNLYDRFNHLTPKQGDNSFRLDLVTHHGVFNANYILN